MSEIRFYHLQRAVLEDTLPVMLERAARHYRQQLVQHRGRELAAAAAAMGESGQAGFIFGHGLVSVGVS